VSSGVPRGGLGCSNPPPYRREVGSEQGRTGGGFGVLKSPPPEIQKAPQNRAKLNSIVKTVKNC